MNPHHKTNLPFPSLPFSKGASPGFPVIATPSSLGGVAAKLPEHANPPRLGWFVPALASLDPSRRSFRRQGQPAQGETSPRPRVPVMDWGGKGSMPPSGTNATAAMCNATVKRPFPLLLLSVPWASPTNLLETDHMLSSLTGGGGLHSGKRVAYIPFSPSRGVVRWAIKTELCRGRRLLALPKPGSSRQPTARAGLGSATLFFFFFFFLCFLPRVHSKQTESGLLMGSWSWFDPRGTWLRWRVGFPAPPSPHYR